MATADEQHATFNHKEKSQRTTERSLAPWNGKEHALKSLIGSKLPHGCRQRSRVSDELLRNRFEDEGYKLQIRRMSLSAPPVDARREVCYVKCAVTRAYRFLAHHAMCSSFWQEETEGKTDRHLKGTNE